MQQQSKTTKHQDKSGQNVSSYSAHHVQQSSSTKKQPSSSQNRPGSAPKQVNHALVQSHSHGHVGAINTRTIANHHPTNYTPGALTASRQHHGDNQIRPGSSKQSSTAKNKQAFIATPSQMLSHNMNQTNNQNANILSNNHSMVIRNSNSTN